MDESDEVFSLTEATSDEQNIHQLPQDCVERWKNAGPEARKKMFSLFAVSGVFLTACRHGHVLLICDMIQSGEL